MRVCDINLKLTTSLVALGDALEPHCSFKARLPRLCLWRSIAHYSRTRPRVKTSDLSSRLIQNSL